MPCAGRLDFAATECWTAKCGLMRTPELPGQRTSEAVALQVLFEQHRGLHVSGGDAHQKLSTCQSQLRSSSATFFNTTIPPPLDWESP